MKWGTFGPVHRAVSARGCRTAVGLYFILKNRSQRVQILMPGILSFAGISSDIYNMLAWGSPLAYLPLHLCSLNALLQVNYMYSLAPENPLLQVFYSIIPAPYWYMYMIVPILVVYLLIVYAPQLLEKKRENMPSPRKN